MGAFCSDAEKPATNVDAPLSFEGSDSDDSNIHSFVSCRSVKSQNRESEDVRNRNHSYLQRYHTCPAVYTHRGHPKKRRINHKDRKIVVKADPEETCPTTIFPEEWNSTSERVTFGENDNRDVIGSAFDLCDYAAKTKIKKILEPIFVDQVQRIVDKSVEELLVKMSLPQEFQNLVTNEIGKHDCTTQGGFTHFGEKFSSARTSGHTSKRSNGHLWKSESSANSHSFKSQFQRRENKKYIFNQPNFRASNVVEPKQLKYNHKGSTIDFQNQPRVLNYRPIIKMSFPYENQGQSLGESNYLKDRKENGEILPEYSNSPFDDIFECDEFQSFGGGPKYIKDKKEHEEILAEYTKSPFDMFEGDDFEQKVSPVNTAAETEKTKSRYPLESPPKH